MYHPNGVSLPLVVVAVATSQAKRVRRRWWLRRQQAGHRPSRATDRAYPGSLDDWVQPGSGAPVTVGPAAYVARVVPGAHVCPSGRRLYERERPR